MIATTDVKLNLGLRVLGRRSDGYHDLETLFVPCNAFGDTLEIKPAGRFGISIDGPCYGGWNPSRDLTARAWQLMHEEYGIGPVEIKLTKTAPVGAGLGGGSADGACALKMLSDLFWLGLSEKRLAALALELGSDCPFFIYDRPMFATGRGEILEPSGIDLSGYRIRVELPYGVQVSTREAYASLKLHGHASQPGEGKGLKELLQHPIEEWKGLVINDFEEGVFESYPQIAAMKEKMYAEGAVYASMSGSGSAVFGIFAKR